MDIVFVKTRYEYPSYCDYWNLINLAKFDVNYVDQVDFSRENVVYIVSPVTGEWRPHRDGQRGNPYNAHVVWWCLERPSGTDGLADFVRGTKRFLDNWYCDEVWIADNYLAKQVADSRVKFVVLGSHKELGDPERASKSEYKYELAHMSYGVFRRARILDELEKRNFSIAPNRFPPGRHEVLMDSAFMLNIHQDDWPILEPLRFALAAAYALPLVTETCKDLSPYGRRGPKHYVWDADYGDLVGDIASILSRDYEPFRAMGKRLFDMMTTDFSFRNQVLLAVGEATNETAGLVIL